MYEVRAARRLHLSGISTLVGVSVSESPKSPGSLTLLVFLWISYLPWDIHSLPLHFYKSPQNHCCLALCLCITLSQMLGGASQKTSHARLLSVTITEYHSDGDW